MRWLPFCLGVAGALSAQIPLHIVAVERRGPPPYEPADRIYCVDGGQDHGLHVGDRLAVKRSGDVRAIGYLRVIDIRSTQADTRFEPKGTIYPMKGDLALPEVLSWMPEVRPMNLDPMPPTPHPHATTEAPPREGILFFLPQQGELSPAGVKKLEAWVKAWGAKGRWAVQVPTDKAVPPALQKQRTESLQAALKALGVDHAGVELDPRTTESKFEPTWVKHWD